jgi:hypothetical protein
MHKAQKNPLRFQQEHALRSEWDVHRELSREDLLTVLNQQCRAELPFRLRSGNKRNPNKNRYRS